MAAATVSHLSARIGDGRDSLARGVISHVNRAAALAGVVIGMRARAAARLLCFAPSAHSKPQPYTDGRWKLGMRGSTDVWALDSVGKLAPADDGRILLIGSHGGLHGGRPQSALDRGGRAVEARAVAFNDAGIGVDGSGVSRLPELERRGIAAVTVSHATARIGDGRSMNDALISHVNAVAATTGARVDCRPVIAGQMACA